MTPKKSIYARLADRGLTYEEAARAAGVTVTSVKRAAQVYGLRFRNTRPTTGVSLTADQREDMGTLMIKGGYTAEEALRIVTKPKERIRAVPKGAF